MKKIYTSWHTSFPLRITILAVGVLKCKVCQQILSEFPIWEFESQPKGKPYSNEMSDWYQS